MKPMKSRSLLSHSQRPQVGINAQLVHRMHPILGQSAFSKTSRIRVARSLFANRASPRRACNS